MARRSLLTAAAAATADLGLIAEAAASLGIDIAALQEAEAAGLVVVADGRIEFRHPLVRSAVHNAAEPAERRAVHRALAQALAGERDADERAWHLGAAAFGPDEEAAAALALAAARARDRGAYAAASLTAERAARLSASGDLRGHRLLEAAWNAWIAGGGARAVSLLDEAAPLAADGDAAVDIEHLRGHSALARGDAMQAREIFKAAAQRVPPEAGRRAALLWTDAAFASLSAGQIQSMLDDAHAALAALPADDEGTEACTARLRSGWRSCCAAPGTKGPALCAPVSAWRAMGSCSRGRRCRGAGRSRRRSSCASPDCARFSSGRSESARDRGVGGSPRGAARHARARRRHDRPLAGGQGQVLRGCRARARHGTTGRAMRGARGLGVARGARRTRGSCRDHAAEASLSRASSGAGCTRPGYWLHSRISSSPSGGRPRRSSG